MGRPEGVDTHFTRDFPHALCTCDHTHIVAQGVSGAESLHRHAIHDVTCLSVRCWSSFCLPSLYLSLLPFLFHCLPVLCLAQLPQCRHRRGLEPLHSRTMRSIAPWRFSILSQVMSPISSTTSSTQRLLQFFQDESVDMDTEPSYSCDAELDVDTIRKALSSFHCSFRNEKNQRN